MSDLNILHYRRDIDRKLLRYRFISRDLNDFWLFTNKYLVVLNKVKSSKERKVTNLYKELSGKVELTDEQKQFFKDSENFKERSIPSHIFTDLNTILLAFINFQNKQKAEKLEKLKQSQQALPVYQFRQEIIDSVKKDKVVIIAGDTGCGKSTQVPQYLIQSGFNRIACTQPRRLACISLCKRVAYETQTESTSEIGYQIRFEKKRNDLTKIIFITEGLLLRQVNSGDGLLSDYDVVVLDEIHERHLQGDFLLGILKCLSIQRNDFRLVLMSATINIELFTQYFNDLRPAVITVPGRLYPIEVHYLPVIVEEKSSKQEKLDPGPYIRVLNMIDDKYSRIERGDVLIFVSGMSEITTLVDAVTCYNEKSNKWIILPLHSSLSLAEQDKVFDYAPEGYRKCIISTNIAETSLTIDGIRFVIDSGMVKEMSYDAVCKMQRLKEFWVSKASADQRKGRAGRSGPGVCYRLYSEADYQAMTDYTTPEILRVPLDSLLLQMISMGLPDSRKFPFLESPNIDTLEATVLQLKTHGCLTEDEKITSLGKMLSMLPVDIPLGKMLIFGSMFHQIEAALSLAAVLSVQSIYTNRAFRDLECETARANLESDHGDPITLLNALREWLEIKREGKGTGESGVGGSKRWARTRGFEEQRFYEIIKLRRQFKDLLQESGLLKENESLEEMSSSDRALRHGQLKILKQLKRSHQDNNTSSKRKRLKAHNWEIVNEDNESHGVDMRDVDFRLSHDDTKLQGLVSGSTATSYKDLIMLKIILLSGLYPQLAVPDEFNHAKGVNEQLFHTRNKPFVFLHPMSLFGNKSQILQLQESDIVQAPGFNSRNPLSSKHQVLIYMSLLETNKPYLVNTLRMPLLESLLLMSSEIHTNNDFTVLVCDNWIKLKFPHPEPIEKLLISVVKLRTCWHQLLTSRVEEKDCSEIEHTLSDGLIKLMMSNIVYSYKRLLQIDLKSIYNRCYDSASVVSDTGINPFMDSYTIETNTSLGGLRLTPYLTYNCLLECSSLEPTSWQCDNCNLTAPLSSLERLQHLHVCMPSNSDNCNEEREINHKRKANSILYSCQTCNKDLFLTPVEILKHKKGHSSSST